MERETNVASQYGELTKKEMASRPGVLTDWPWKQLGNLKYVILAPWVVHSMYSFATKGDTESDPSNFLIFPFILSRMLHNQLWISLSRYLTAKGKNRILDKTIEFEQVDRESNWDDQIIFNAILFYMANAVLPGASHLPLWRIDGIVLTVLLHMGPVEFLYYWLHRALHHHYLYARYHSHHHSSVVTEPITSVIHPFAEHIMYFILFAIPLLTMVFTGTASMAAILGYITYIDFMNNMGHCNIELVPKRVFHILPPLKYLMYTPSFHSLHHTQFRTNYSLFMPLYDYIYSTMDTSTEIVYETSLKRREDSPNVVHLTHPTSLDSIYHLQLGFSSLASGPYMSKWYLVMLWPVTYWSILLARIYNRTFIVERNTFNNLKMQTWAVPRFKFQGEELNGNGELYIQKHPNMKIRVVDGSSLAVAVVLNSIPKGAKHVFLRGNISKVAYAIVLVLCQREIQVTVIQKDEYEKLKLNLTPELGRYLVLSSTSLSQKTWLVGDGLSEDEQMKATKGTLFIPFSQFPPTRIRADCVYYNTPAMVAPKALENMHSCENWLPRRVMSAWRVAGIVHALEGWDAHECGDAMFDTEKVWRATLQHGFRPLMT
ncbi:hypothetical protein HHK36_027192 [Tetracentron sinense]|uniref:Uncharacterized protein n=1 Tax=Tetracentron sinense TaxID=13715 RepID=A0A835D5B2_TETSI|nr:hypothetical protein HHK36_027192 [Tetracentron sinense]